MGWKENMGPERAASLAASRLREAPEWQERARLAVRQGNYDEARVSFLQSVESWRQANELTGGSCQVEWEKATAEYEQFVRGDPLFETLLQKIEPVVRENPGILQTEMYRKLTAVPKANVSYALYFAAKFGKIRRNKKGRTYELHPA